jgi:plastocyanin
MRHASVAAAIAAVTFIVAACASSDEAGWTYAPPPTEVAASGAPSGEPSADTSTPPSAPASAPPSAPASAPASAPPSAPASGPASAPASAPSGETVTVTAQGIQFEQADRTVPAGAPFTLEFVNNDAQVPHDIQIRDQSGAALFTSDTFPGVETRMFEAPALPAGPYQFVCTIHPNMIIEVAAE